MLFSRSTEYAIRASVCLADAEPGAYLLARDIASRAELPSHFLAKILQNMTRQGLLLSNKGPSGGFRLASAPARVSLLDLISALDQDEELNRCPLGEQCSQHVGWKQLRSHMMDYLRHTSIADLARAGKAWKKSKSRAGN